MKFERFFLAITFLFSIACSADEMPCQAQINAIREINKNPTLDREILGEIYDEKIGYYTVTYISHDNEDTIFIDSTFPGPKGCSVQSIAVGIQGGNHDKECKSWSPDYSEKKNGKYYYKGLKFKPQHLEETFVTAPASGDMCYYFHQYVRT